MCDFPRPTHDPEARAGRGSRSLGLAVCSALESLRSTSPDTNQALGGASGLAASPALWWIFHERGSNGHGLVSCWGSLWERRGGRLVKVCTLSKRPRLSV